MKIDDITAYSATRIGDISATRWDATGDSYGAERNGACPEVAKLLNARLANMLFNCRSLARDEIELANFIINKLDVDPHYVPSETLLQAIRSINIKLAGDSSAQGAIRTA